MTNEEKEKVALFKYGVISPMITKTLEYNSVQEGIEILGSKEYINPKGEKVSISPGTIERWYYTYKNHGFDTLIGLIASNEEAQSFYRLLPNAKISDEGIWIEL